MRILKKKFIYLKATSFNINLLIIYYYYLQKKFNFFFYKFNKIFFKKQKIITLLKSPHVHKKAREQFELKKFSFIIILKPMFLSK